MKESGLERFVSAQEKAYASALAEIRRANKRSHWMWFVFPQIAGLGHSPISRFYAIRDMAEARAYLAHAVLGPRLKEITSALLAHTELDPLDVLGNVDAKKLHSSMTLFHLADLQEEIFTTALERFFDGRLDDDTVRLLGEEAGNS